MDAWRETDLRNLVDRLGIEGETRAPTARWFETDDGARLHALDWGGDGAPVLLVHGGALTGRTWDYVCVGLRRDFRLVALDQRGHGESSWSDDYSIGRLGADLVQVLEALGGAHLVGMSLGGVAAAECAALRPGLVRSLALVDVAPGVDFEGTARMRAFFTKVTGGPSSEAVADAALQVSPRSDPLRVRYRMRAMMRQDANGRWVWKRDVRRPVDFAHILARVEAMGERLAGFEKPLLLVRGGRSLTLPRPAAEAFARRFAQGRCVEIDDAGHNVQEDQPRRLILALRTFWTGRTEPAGLAAACAEERWSVSMTKTFKAGDRVKWDHSQGATTGKVVKKQTTPTKIKGHKVAASKDNPEYIVKSAKTGAKAAHKPGELRRT